MNNPEPIAENIAANIAENTQNSFTFRIARDTSTLNRQIADLRSTIENAPTIVANIRNTRRDMIRRHVDARRLQATWEDNPDFLTIAHIIGRQTVDSDMSHAGAEMKFIRWLNRERVATRDRTRSCSRDIRIYQHSAANAERELPMRLQELARANAVPEQVIPVDIEALHTNLIRHPAVQHIKTWTRREPGEADCLNIRLYLDNMEMRTADPEFSRENNYPESVPLKPMALSLRVKSDNLGTAKLELRGVRFQGMSGNALVHPHWLTNDRPCLGDFSGPIAEALSIGDLETTLSMYIEFLHWYYPNDPAGGRARGWTAGNHPLSSDTILPPDNVPAGGEASFKLTSKPAAVEAAA